ncbi:SGNH/GDSL hydrolase family protein [Neobacillus sp. 179-C4.2 HS]|uniref:SGNH/GDSL hydrolase family protein n=1 Tax=Neobacillus driksii TaxID=3035913 RepID=A0ABV4YN21_9BACI|nr:SGNH/GDSL hydrolase family protein [Neobacillus sp. 179.-C4.2 HS]MDP5193565.1 SGNH/GDSL hydrolase family protein [Neobacillus sp. 179.-C4.2 HS]
MKKVFTLLILSAFFLSSCSQSNRLELHKERTASAVVYEEIPDDFVPKEIKIISAGDSLTEGVGDSTNTGGYLPYLRTLLEEEKGIKEVDFYNFGVKGNRAPQLLNRLQTEDMKESLSTADLVILTIGGNDIMKVVKDNITNLELSIFEKEKVVYIKNLIEIMNSIIRVNPEAYIVLVGVYNPFSQWFSDVKELDKIVSDWNAASQGVVSNYSNAYFVGIEDLFINPTESLLHTDNFHPNDKGYELIAERLNETLEERTLPDLVKKAYMVSKEEN